DIRDLVELTVGKMEMYHLVAALFLESAIALYCEGRIHTTAPPFVLSLFYMSVASAFLYLLLAVWLSMHASIASHSFGVRLLTRFVRLPVPGLAQIDVLNARLADFERQGLKQILRVPGTGQNQEWRQRRPLDTLGVVEEGARVPDAQHAAAQVLKQKEDLLGPGMQAFNKSENFMGSARNLPGKHVELFRRLQAKWQCFDAYARVCMAIGANQLLLGLEAWIVIISLLTYSCPSICFALLFAMSFGGLALAYLDIAHLGDWKICLLQLCGAAPCWIAAVSIVACEKDAQGKVSPEAKFPASPLCFLVALLWFEGLLRVAWPSNDEATLPRRFRAVLFLDVFADAGLEDAASEDHAENSRAPTSGELQRQTSGAS
ncbi:unnamed protein product, partial [Polarella glacialis]